MFLSYASQDVAAASRIREALTASGIEVWFDQGHLGTGDEWDGKIRRQIKECVLFVPVISATTQARHEGYFRIEWELAEQRAMGIAKGVPFILPVVIDDTRESNALVPEKFLKVQWTRLPGGDVPPEIQRQFLKLWKQRTVESSGAQGEAFSIERLPTETLTFARTTMASPIGRIALTVALAGVLAMSAYLVWHAWSPGLPKGVRMRSVPSRITADVPEKSIAVLPFANLSANQENAFFTDGVQDEILTYLAKIADLKVISRTSVMQYKTGVRRNLREIGEELGVAHVLEGSVQRAGGKVRVNAQLIDARTDGHLWAQVYDRPLDDVFLIQSEIAKAIADQLQAKLSPSEKLAIERPPTSDVTAFDLYSRAKTLLLTTSFSAQSRQNLLQAADLLNQAVAHDPQFFLAYCQLAYTHGFLYFLGLDHTPERRALAEAAIQDALRLRPDAGEAHLARAENFYRVDLDYGRALAELEAARRTLPNDARVFELTGYIQRRQGRLEEALHNLERALELDPRNFFTLQQIALSYQLVRRYAEEVGVLDRALIINPSDTDTKVARALLDFDWKADSRPLHRTIESIRKESPDAVGSVADSWLIWALAERDGREAESALAALGENMYGIDAVNFNHDFSAGLIARMTNDPAKARAAFSAARGRQEKVVQAQPDYGPAVCVLGLIDASLGRKDEALREGRRAVALLPVAKDSINGVHMIEYFAMIAAWVGEKDLACEQLAAVTRLPGTLSYGQLKLMPQWDPLRGNPRFEKNVASLAPKTNPK